MLLLCGLVLWVSFGPACVFFFSLKSTVCHIFLQNVTFLMVSSSLSPGFILLTPVFFPCYLSLYSAHWSATWLLLWTVPFHMCLQSILARNGWPAPNLDSLFLIIQSPVTKKQAHSYKSSPIQPARENHTFWVIVGPLMDRNLVVPRVRERKRLMSPGFRGKPIEPCS